MKTYKEYRPPIAISDAQQCSPKGNGHGSEKIWHKKCDMFNRPGRLPGGGISAELFLHRMDHEHRTSNVQHRMLNGEKGLYP